MKLFVGLGNPGSSYAKTRHNAGRLLIESLPADFGLKLTKKRNLQASIATLDWEVPVCLAYPACFMNLSGGPVANLVRHFDVDPAKDLLVVVDDAALPFGRLRFRPKGSDGGHKGLRSIEASLRTQHYARLRIGIEGRQDHEPLEEYVLKNFSAAERQRLEPLFEKAKEACHLWLTVPAGRVMDSVNDYSEKG